LNTTLGLDEHTGIIIDFQTSECQVLGVSSVSLVRECDPEIYATGSMVPLDGLGQVRVPEPIEVGIPAEVWEMVTTASESKDDIPDTPPEEVQALVEQRQKARAEKKWADSDRLRDEIAKFGWQVQDTSEGQKLVRA
jgi:hypothetical protein